MIPGPGQHVQHRGPVLLQEFPEAVDKNVQLVDAPEPGTKIGLHSFKKVNIVPAPQFVCRKRAKIIFVFVQGHINQAVTGSNGSTARKPHDKIRQQALSSPVFFPNPEIIQLF